MNSRLISAGLLTLLLCTGCVSPPEDKVDNSSAGMHFMQQGLQAFSDSDYPGATKMFNRALAYYQSIDDTQGVLSSRINLAELYLSVGDLENARQQLDRAAILAQYEDVQSIYERITLLEANLAFINNDYAQCESLLDELVGPVATAEDVGIANEHTWAAVLSTRARLAIARNDPDMVLWLEQLQTALEAQNNVDAVLYGRMYRLQSEISRRHGDYNKAEAELRLAYTNYHRVDYRPGIAATLEELGLVAMQREQWTEAEHLLRRAFIVSIYLRDQEGCVSLLENLASVYDHTGKDRQKQITRQWIEMLDDENFSHWSSLIVEQDRL